MKSLVVSISAEDRSGLIYELANTVLESGCTVQDSRVATLAGEFSALLLVSGNWNNLAKLEVQLAKLQSANMQLRANRVEWPYHVEDKLPYAVEVITTQQPTVVQRLSYFFFRRNVSIEELHSRGYSAPHTATQMFSVNLIVGIPAQLHVATIREEFMDFCDENNWDAVMEPLKS